MRTATLRSPRRLSGRPRRARPGNAKLRIQKIPAHRSQRERKPSYNRRVAGALLGSLPVAKIIGEQQAPAERSDMRHVLSALVQNQPGVLAHISGMLASRGFNIDSLAVGETETPDLSRMTFVVRGDDAELEQVRKQLGKVVTVVKVLDISSEDFVERDLMLIKVTANAAQRTEISLLVEMFRGRVVDISQTNMMMEIAGQESK